MTLRSIALALTASLLGCGSSQPMGGVRVVTNVPQATLYVDDELRGPASAYEGHYMRLEPGTHRLALEHGDYLSEYIDVTVVEAVAVTVTMEMRPRSSSTTPSTQEGSRNDVSPSTP